MGLIDKWVRWPSGSKRGGQFAPKSSSALGISSSTGSASSKASSVSGVVQNQISGLHPHLQRASRETLKAIDSVHSDGGLKNVSLMSGDLGIAHGRYHIPTRKVLLSPKATHPHAILAHEMGHAIDFQLLANKPTPEYRKLVGLMSDSPTMKKWRTAHIFGIKMKLKGNRAVRVIVSPVYVSYYTHPREMFARAYAQYIARRTRNSNILQGIRDQQRLGGQWPDREFEAIDRAMGETLRSIGWRTYK